MSQRSLTAQISMILFVFNVERRSWVCIARSPKGYFPLFNPVFNPAAINKNLIKASRRRLVCLHGAFIMSMMFEDRLRVKTFRKMMDSCEEKQRFLYKWENVMVAPLHEKHEPKEF